MDTKRPHSIGEKQHCAPSCCLANTQLYAVDSIRGLAGVTEPVFVYLFGDCVFAVSMIVVPWIVNPV